MSSTKLLHHWFLDGLARNPEGTALRINDRRWTYAEADRTARSWAAALHGGPRAPRRVGVLAAKSEESLLGFLAALYAGCTVVPLNPEYPLERNRDIAAAARLDALIVDRAGAAQLDAVAAAAPPVVTLAPRRAEWTGTPPDTAVVVPDPAGDRPPAQGSDSLAYILFTSGSTGRPKGVPIRHGNVSAFLSASLPRYDFGPEDVFGQVYELTFDLSMFEMWCAWASGACLTVLNRLQALNPARYIRDHGITVWTSTPSLVAALRTRGLLAGGSLPSVRHTVFCGEPLPEESAAYWSAAAPGTAIDNLYGPTELTIACTAYRWSAAAGSGTVPIGELNAGLRHVLVEDGLVGSDAGELCVTGPQMFDGYLDPANDADRFLTHEGLRWYRTGDRVRRTADGTLVHLGRGDGQVKIHGYRVELSEVEEALRACAPGAEAVVLTVPEAAGPVLAAFLIGDDTDGLTTRTAQDLARRLPPYMLPAHLWALSDPPLNANGKTDRLRLREEAERRLAGDLAGTS
ncbi:amino acid adenylation domain-containing protein [Streptomyces sp. NPDC012466]|jgi:amino acid adenylation domain-containing protein|uniref:D-alanine--poly(phosphoribitol) ligase n=1 Tax=Streptomyces sp. NPDC012466 TaxID=3364835 RepID=UPI0036E595D9